MVRSVISIPTQDDDQNNTRDKSPDVYVLCEGHYEFMFERIDVRLCNAQCVISGADVCFPVCGRQNSDRVEGKPQSPAQ